MHAFHAIITCSILATGLAGTKVTWPMKTSPVSYYPKYTTVFGLSVFANASLTNAQFQHVASVLAEWLDNDEDGCVDNPLVLTKMLNSNPQPAVLVTGPKGPKVPKAKMAFNDAGYACSAPLNNAEILPNCAGPKATSKCADASLEEIIHIISSEGYAAAWPATFSEGPNALHPKASSTLTKAMDKARGGKFLTIPSVYPSSAWYKYYDTSCEYECQATEYIYWGITAWVGALAGRGGDNEWKLNTRAKLVAGDACLTAVIKNRSVYKLPTISPTGSYSGAATCKRGKNYSFVKPTLDYD